MVGAGGKLAVTNRPKALAVLIAVFLLGAILGSAGSYYWSSRTSVSKDRYAENKPPPRRPRLPDLLEMTQDQRDRFGEIMSEFRMQLEALQKEQEPKIEAFQKEQAPKFEALRTETDRKILSILNEEQRIKYNELAKEREKRMRVPRGRGFAPPPPSQRDRKPSSFSDKEEQQKHRSFLNPKAYPEEYSPHQRDFSARQ